MAKLILLVQKITLSKIEYYISRHSLHPSALINSGCEEYSCYTKLKWLEPFFKKKTSPNKNLNPKKKAFFKGSLSSTKKITLDISNISFSNMIYLCDRFYSWPFICRNIFYFICPIYSHPPECKDWLRLCVLLHCNLQARLRMGHISVEKYSSTNIAFFPHFDDSPRPKGKSSTI